MTFLQNNITSLPFVKIGSGLCNDSKRGSDASPSNVFKSMGNSNLVVWAEPDPSPSIQEVDAKAFCM